MNSQRSKIFLGLAVAMMAVNAVRHGEEGDPPVLPTTKEDLDKAIAAAVTAAETRVKSEFEGTATKNRELLDELKPLKALAKSVEGLDIEGLKELKGKIENDNILKLFSEGKHTEALEAATERLRVTHNAEKESLTTTITELQESNRINVELVDKLLIDGGSQSAFILAKGKPTAVDDVAARARQTWKVEKGELVARNDKGEMIQGAKGPLTMAEWAEGLKKTAPHLFPDSEGAGLGGEGGGGGGDGGLEAQILAASAAGDMKKLRELRKKRDARG